MQCLDCSLTFNEHVASAIDKAHKAMHLTEFNLVVNLYVFCLFLPDRTHRKLQVIQNQCGDEFRYTTWYYRISHLHDRSTNYNFIPLCLRRSIYNISQI